jgi:gamma-glutamylcyclotransferase (GGCT)/AIG2-like uncharacterized protein YtfP
MNKNNFVFVYGTLRHGEGNWSWALKDAADLIGYASTPGEMYTLGGFPGVILPTTDDRAAGKVVKGEVFACSDETLKTLDRLESEGSMYHRRLVSVEYSRMVSDVPEPPRTVYIYEYGRIPPRPSLIPSGDWLEHKYNPAKG